MKRKQPVLQKGGGREPETVTVRITKRLRDEVLRRTPEKEPFWMSLGRFTNLGG